MNLPLPIDATKEEVSMAMEFYANTTANMAKMLLKDTSSIIPELPMLADMLDRLLKLSSNIQQLAVPDNNIRAERAVFRIMCHLLSLIGAANDLISPIEIKDYEELINDVYNNARGVLEACRHLSFNH
jgi:hypothetical protein